MADLGGVGGGRKGIFETWGVYISLLPLEKNTELSLFFGTVNLAKIVKNILVLGKSKYMLKNMIIPNLSIMIPCYSKLN